MKAFFKICHWVVIVTQCKGDLHTYHIVYEHVGYGHVIVCPIKCVFVCIYT